METLVIRGGGYRGESVDRSVLDALSLVVALAVWWLGIRRIELTSAVKSVLSVLEFGVLIGTVVTLGWLGLAIFVAANVVGLLLYSVRMAMRHETIVIEIANCTEASKEEVQALLKRLGRRKELKWVSPIERAEWVRELAHRGRGLPEIEIMAPSIAKLSLVYGQPEAPWLISRFDQIMRLYGEPASRAESVAETIYASVRASAATFPEMLEAFIAAVAPIAV